MNIVKIENKIYPAQRLPYFLDIQGESAPHPLTLTNIVADMHCI